jgi:hypothetical protein
LAAVPQQALLSAQHFIPFSQQPGRVLLSQQVLFALQQASFEAQQSLLFSLTLPVPALSSPNASNEPVNNLVNME